ncbi:MAG: VCBS repeat-containing protein, partial [Planctomycetaceae bacterium]|nr:VCBS repeat-containing protein [Planctomycetaceae bacterium]
MAIVAMLAIGGRRAHADEVPLVFNAPVFTTLPEPFFPTMFRARDLDGDGKPDLALAGRDPDDRLLIYRGTGLGGFVPHQTLLAEGFTDWLEFGDADGDGIVDIVSAWRGDLPRLVVYRGLGGGQFAAPTVLGGIELGVGRDPQGVALGDFDQDGDLDIAICSYVGHSIEVYHNLGGLAFERVQRLRVAQYFGGLGYPRLIEAGDIDGDGDLDLVGNELGGGRIFTMRNVGGRFTRAVEYRAPQIGNERPGVSAVHLADIDGDGDLDAYAPALLLETAQRIIWFRNDGTGRFNERILGNGPVSGYFFAVKMADLDTDGDLDAICGVALPGTVTVGRATSVADFTFEDDGYYPFGQLVRHCDAVDYDGDCDLDLIVIDGPGRTILTRRNVTPQQGCGGLASDDRDVDDTQGGDAKTADAGKADAAPLPADARRDWNEDGVVDGTDVAIWIATRSEARAANAGSPAPTKRPSPVKELAPALDARSPAKVERKEGLR